MSIALLPLEVPDLNPFLCISGWHTSLICLVVFGLSYGNGAPIQKKYFSPPINLFNVNLLIRPANEPRRAGKKNFSSLEISVLHFQVSMALTTLAS